MKGGKTFVSNSFPFSFSLSFLLYLPLGSSVRNAVGVIQSILKANAKGLWQMAYGRWLMAYAVSF
jgi:hypothetical protein